MKVLCIGCEEVRQVLDNGLGLGVFHVRSSILIGRGLDQMTKKPGRCKKKLSNLMKEDEEIRNFSKSEVKKSQVICVKLCLQCLVTTQLQARNLYLAPVAYSAAALNQSSPLLHLTIMTVDVPIDC